MGAHAPVPSAPQERAQQHVAGLRYLDEGRQAVVAIATAPRGRARRPQQQRGWRVGRQAGAINNII
jgi:hypothetical protein